MNEREIEIEIREGNIRIIFSKNPINTTISSQYFGESVSIDIGKGEPVALQISGISRITDFRESYST
jgi:hypothetical protein